MQGLGFKAPGSGVVFAVGVFLLLCSAAESPASQQPVWAQTAKKQPLNPAIFDYEGRHSIEIAARLRPPIFKALLNPILNPKY